MPQSGATLGEANVLVGADLSKLISGFAVAQRESQAFTARAGKAAATTAASFGALSKNTQSLQRAIQAVDGPLGGVASRLRATQLLFRDTGPFLAAYILGLSAVALATNKWFAATIDAERQAVLLRNALRQTGREAELSAQSMLEYSEALQKTTSFEDEAITAVQTRLSLFERISSDVIPRATKAILDYSEATGKDLSTAAVNIGAAINNPAEALERLNRTEKIFTGEQARMIEEIARGNRQFDEFGKEIKAVDLILEGLEGRFKGTADAARNTLGGALKALGNELSNMTEATGAPLRFMTDSVNLLNDNLKGVVETVKGLGVVGGTIIASKFVGPFVSGLAAAIASEYEFRKAVLSGNAVILGSAEALAMKTAAQVHNVEVVATQIRAERILAETAHTAAVAETELAAQNVNSIITNKKLIETEIELAAARASRGLAVRDPATGKMMSGRTIEQTKAAKAGQDLMNMTKLQTQAEQQLTLAFMAETAALNAVTAAQVKETVVAEAATVAQTAHTAAVGRLTFMARGAETLKRAFAGVGAAIAGATRFLGGPWGVALTAATIGLYFFSNRLFDAEDSTEQFNDAMRQSRDVLDSAEESLRRFNLEQLQGAIAANAKALADTQALLVEKQRAAALKELANASALASGQPAPFADTTPTKEQTDEINDLTLKILEATEAFVALNLKMTSRPPPQRRDTPVIDPELAKRREEFVKSLREEVSALEEVIPQYQSESISLDEVNTKLETRKALTDLEIKAGDNLVTVITKLIARRDALNKTQEKATAFQAAEQELRILKEQIPFLLASGRSRENINEELSFQLDLARELKDLGIEQGSVEADFREEQRRNQLEINRGLELELSNREAVSQAIIDQVDFLFDIEQSTRALAEENRFIGAPEQIRAVAQFREEMERYAIAIEAAGGDATLLRNAIDDLTRSFAEQSRISISGGLFKGMSDDLKRLNLELKIQENTFGMTAGAAAAYRFEQEALFETSERLGSVTEDEVKRIKELGSLYYVAAQRARDFAVKQELVASASSEISSFIRDLRNETISLGDAFMRLADSIADAVIQGSLFGQGPLAGIMGTAEGGGLIGGAIGSALGLGKAAEEASKAAEAAATTALTTSNTALTAATTAQTSATVALTTTTSSLAGANAGLITAMGALTTAVAALTVAIGAKAGTDAASGISDAIQALPVAHKGGIVGTAMPTRRVAVRAGVRVPRYHQGLRQGERLGIFEDGEEIVPKQEVRRRRGRGDTFIANFNGVRTGDDTKGAAQSQMFSAFSDAMFVSRRRNR